MDKTFTDNMKEKLAILKKEILTNLALENEEFNEIIEDQDPKDLVEIAADDIDRKILEALSTQELNSLRLIESALCRIENGRYGTCVRCGEKIPKERLSAIPFALLCIKCKTNEERRKSK